MANMLFANNCNTTLNGSITVAATSMVVTSATGFPSPTGSQYFYCTLADAATQTTIEIVKVTAVSGTTFTIVRGQDGTSGTIFASGAVVSLRLVRASLNDFPKLDENNTFSFAPTFNTALAVGSGGTGLTTLTAGYIPYGNGTSAFSSSSGLVFDGTNLGIGATPTYASACTNIEMPYGATLSSRSNTAAPQFAMMSNAVGNWYAPTYKITGYATQYTQQGFDGTHKWYTAVSGTAGNTITFTQAMTLFNTGGLSLGNTIDPGAGNLRFNTTNSNGIYFGSSSLLADYETGTFTPNIVFGGGNTGITGSFLGSYTKIGRLVQFNIFITLSNKGSSTGGATILGLPYTSNSATPTSIIMDAQFLTYTGNYLLAYNPASASSLDLYQVSTASTTQLTNTAFANNTVLRIAGTYFV